MSPIEIHVKAFLEAQGANEATAGVHKLTEAMEDYLTVMDAQDRFMRERLGQSMQDMARNMGQLTHAAQAGSGLLVDQARVALEAGDYTQAGKFLGQAVSAGEPLSMINSLGTRLLSARRTIPAVPGADDLGEAPWTDDRSERRYGRIETLLERSRIAAGMGRLTSADSNVQEAQLILEEMRKSEKNTDALEKLTRVLEDHKKSLDEQRQGGGNGGSPDITETLRDFAMGKGLSGLPGGLGGLLGRIGGFLGPGGLALLGGGAILGGANLAFGYLSNLARGGREEGEYFLNTGRQQGTNDQIYEQFLNAGRVPGLAYASTRRELAELGYNTREAGEFARMLGPEASAQDSFRDSLAGLRLTRYLGADMGDVGGLFTAARRGGVAESGQMDSFSRVLFQAVREGTKDGVSQAETFATMNRYLEGLASQGITGDLRSAANMAALLDELRGTGNRGLMGEAGARQMQGLIGGLAHPGSAGLDIMVLQALQGGNLSGAALGLEGGAATQYDRMRQSDPYAALRLAQERIAAGNPAALRAVGRSLSANLGGNATLEAELFSQMGLSREGIAAIQGQFGSVGNFLSSASDADIKKYLSGKPQDIAPGGEAQRLGLAAQLQKYQEGELERLKSLTAALQDMDLLVRNNILDMFQELYKGGRDAAAALGVLDPERVKGMVEYSAGLGNPNTPLPQSKLDATTDPGGTRIIPSTAPGASPSQKDAAATLARTGKFDISPETPRTFQSAMGGNVSIPLKTPGQPYTPAEKKGLIEKYGPQAWIDMGHEGLDYAVGSGMRSDPVPNPWPAGTRVTEVWKSKDGNWNAKFQLPNGDMAQILHLVDLKIKKGDVLERGQLLGYEGYLNSYHIHVEPLSMGGKRVNARDKQAVADWYTRQGYVPGFAGGGYTGDGFALDEAGVVHKGEFVMNKRATEQHRGLLEALNLSLTPTGRQESIVRLIAEGGIPIFRAQDEDPAANRLTDLLNGALAQFSNEQRSGFNAGQRRGRSQ